MSIAYNKKDHYIEAEYTDQTKDRVRIITCATHFLRDGSYTFRAWRYKGDSCQEEHPVKEVSELLELTIKEYLRDRYTKRFYNENHC